MSQSGKQIHEMNPDPLADRLHKSLNFDQNKPDFKEIDLATYNNNNNTPTKQTTPIPPKRSNATHSGELEKTRSGATSRFSKPGHRRSSSTGAPLIYSGNASPSYYNSNTNTSSSGSTSTSTSTGGSNGGVVSGTSSISSVSSPNSILYPTGNICPSGKILKSNMNARASNRTDKLGSGTVNYGHGNIMKGGGGGKSDCNVVKWGLMSCDAEEVKRVGNDMYKRGNFSEALLLYDRAIGIMPENAAYRSNRAAALTMLGRLGEAVSECEEAVRLDSGYWRAHQRLASLYLRLGQIENARHHLCFHGQQPDATELQKLHSLEKHISRCTDARKIGDWKGVLRECDAAMVAGAVSSPQIIACKAEAFLKLQQHADADFSLSNLPRLEPYPASCSQTKIFGILSEAYVLYVQAKVDMAFGRFENAAAAAEKAGLIDFNNIEVAMLLNNVKLVSKARSRGKDLFNAGKYAEACSAYGEGLKYDLCNTILYCNRAVCWSKLGLWEQSVEDCNHALKIQPNYTKALLRRAVSNAKLERWEAAVRDYEVLRKELPGDNEVAESLSRAQDALRKSSRGIHSAKPPVIQAGSDVLNAPTCSPGGSKAETSIGSHKNSPDL